MKNETKTITTGLELLEFLTTNPTATEVEAILAEALAGEDLTKRAEDEYREWHLIGREMWLRRETEYEVYIK